MLTHLFLFLLLAAIFFLPGGALLVASGAWARWPGLQRYIVAVGLSVSFYPILLYAIRFAAPGLPLTPPIMGGLLLFMAAVVGWGMWRQAAFSWRFGPWEWAALLILALTFASRFWIAYTHPYPAWSDSLHHTLLTQMTAVDGRLPFTLEPYFPHNLRMYHLGIYSISGTFAMLGQLPAHTALLWTAQFLNALCGVGVYLALDRYVGRPGAVVGLAVAGLFSAHPALWVNWGRFTQLSAQMLLPIAWVLFLELFPRLSRQNGAIDDRPPDLWLILFAAMGAAAVFLLHFRVAAFYLLLLAPTLLYLLWFAPSWRARWQMAWPVVGVGLFALLIILPVLWAAGENYLAARLTAAAAQTNTAQAAQMRQNYYEFPIVTIPYLAAPLWLLTLGALSLLVGAVRRNWLIGASLLWYLLLLVLGNLYRLNIPVLHVTNLGAILIMTYLPLSLIVGAAVSELAAFVPVQYRRWGAAVGLAGLLLASLPAAHARATTLEEYRHFIAPQDVTAMRWVAVNTPPEAVFAINTYFWLPNFAHGVDAGYWLPYFAERGIVTSSMLYDGATPEYRRLTLARSRAAEALKTDLDAVDRLAELGVTHIYIGARGHFADGGLQLPFLLQSKRVELLYELEGAAVLRLTE